MCIQFDPINSIESTVPKKERECFVSQTNMKTVHKVAQQSSLNILDYEICSFPFWEEFIEKIIES